jgi:uncharacterized protein YkwD
MHSTPRLFALAAGSLLLLQSPNLTVHAEESAAPAEKPAAQQAPAKPAAETPAAQPAQAKGETAPTAGRPRPAYAQPARAGLQSQVGSALPQPTAEELRFVELANRERARRGLIQLRIDPLLIAVARLHSAEMRDKAYFDHQSPTAGIRTPMDRYLKAINGNPGYACVGENLFWATVTDVERGHKAFMESPTHRENVLFPRFEKIGVGIIKNERGEFWVTQMFLTNTDPTPAVAQKMGR